LANPRHGGAHSSGQRAQEAFVSAASSGGLKPASGYAAGFEQGLSAQGARSTNKALSSGKPGPQSGGSHSGGATGGGIGTQLDERAGAAADGDDWGREEEVDAGERGSRSDRHGQSGTSQKKKRKPRTGTAAGDEEPGRQHAAREGGQEDGDGGRNRSRSSGQGSRAGRGSSKAPGSTAEKQQRQTSSTAAAAPKQTYSYDDF
jgi:hypothetical protein